MRKAILITVLLLFLCPLLLRAGSPDSAGPLGASEANKKEPAQTKPIIATPPAQPNITVSQKEVGPQTPAIPDTQKSGTETIPPSTKNGSLDQPAQPQPAFTAPPTPHLHSRRPMMQAAQPESASAPSNLPSGQAAVPNRATIVSSRGNFSLNFDDADIYSVIQTVFGEILKVNYIIDARVKGRVTFRSFAPVPIEKILPLMEVILRLNGVAIIEENELYRIIPISDLSREPSEIKIGRKIVDSELKGKAVLQIVPLRYMQSTEIIKLIGPFVSTNAVIVDVPKANHIIIADTDANVKRILNLIEYFDAEMKDKKGVRVFVYHVQNAKSKDIVAMLQQIFLGGKAQTTDKTAKSSQESTSSAPAIQPVIVNAQSAGHEGVVSNIVKIFADEKLNAVVILGTRDDYEIIKQTISELDLVPRQVLLEGAIASLQLTDNMSLGLAWSLKTNLGNLNPINISFNPTSLTATPASDGLNVIGIDSGTTVRAVINALASQSKAKLLASPHIMVSDNSEARIQVGQQVPIPTSETYAAVGVLPQRTIQYKDIGIILKVKPQINDSGLISLQISQEVSTFSTIVLYSNEKQIILNKTEATTDLVVKDGHTIVIGGLIREDDSDAIAGIPWLIKIPLISYLFGNTTKEKNRTELVILLTPYIIKDQEAAANATYRVTNKITDEEVSKELKQNIHRKVDEPQKETPKNNPAVR